MLSLAEKKNIQMTPWVGRWQTALGPLNYKQTNHQLQQTASYWISPPASQLQLMLLYSVMWESEESMCNHIHSVFGRRHRGQTWNWDDPLRADRSQIHLNHFFFFLSLFRLFNTAPIQNLSGLRSTEVTHFHSTRLLSQRECLTLEKKKSFCVVWLSGCILLNLSVHRQLLQHVPTG